MTLRKCYLTTFLLVRCALPHFKVDVIDGCKRSLYSAQAKNNRETEVGNLVGCNNKSDRKGLVPLAEACRVLGMIS